MLHSLESPPKTGKIRTASAWGLAYNLNEDRVSLVFGPLPQCQLTVTERPLLVGLPLPR